MGDNGPILSAVPAARAWPLLRLLLSVRDHGCLYLERVNDVSPTGHINGHDGLVPHGGFRARRLCR